MEETGDECPLCGAKAKMRVQSRTYKSTVGWEYQGLRTYRCPNGCKEEDGKPMEWVRVGQIIDATEF